ncbi:hypothetical protein [Borrelia persica]|uniref:hypothetical protein n=1 Tax=Borrelia persica TaxID=44448 RepID=UPI000467AF6F|nr:hypothetical protein [Borrelia persica]
MILGFEHRFEFLQDAYRPWHSNKYIFRTGLESESIARLNKLVEKYVRKLRRVAGCILIIYKCGT